MAALAVTPLVLLATAGCRDQGSEPASPIPSPGTSVEQQLEDMESTLDTIESELNDG